MLRTALLGAVLALCAASVHAADPSGERFPPHRRLVLPPDIAYRDPVYRPAPPLRASLPPQPSNVPLYNVPPPHFPHS